MRNDDEYSYEVTLKFKLPQAKRDLIQAINGVDYLSILSDIYNECRKVWKYEDDPSDEKLEFAQQIAEMAETANIWDLE